MDGEDSLKDLWKTPPEVFKAISKLTGIEFDLDPCAAPDNHLGLPYFYTEKEDGLKQPWITQQFGKAYVNCPFSKKIAFMKKAIQEAKKGARVALLLEAVTDANWFHDYAAQGYIYLPRHRIDFIHPKKRGVKGQGRRGYCIIVYELDETRTGLRRGIQLCELSLQVKLEVEA